MGYMPYPLYQKSNLEWSESLPSHWGVKRLKFIVTEPLKYGLNEPAEMEDRDQVRYIRITDIDQDGSLRDDTFKSLPDNIARPYLLQHGDILFARSGATVGKHFIYREGWGQACYAGYLIRARIDPKIALPEFVSYFTDSDLYWQWVSSIFIRATIQNISGEKYANLAIPLPPINEQKSIVNFLERKIATIDTLIAKKQQLIQALHKQRVALISHAVTKGVDSSVRMKESGVEWIGKMPAHWELIRLKFLFKFLNSRRIPLSAEERGDMERVYPYYGASGIIDHVDSYLFDESLILVAEDGANLFSKSTPLAFIAEGKYWVNNHAHILRPRDSRIKYWEYVLTTIEYDPWITGSAQPKLTIENLGSIVLPEPPDDEKQLITNYLNYQISALDTLIVKTREGIDKIQKYRTTLISSAVTGKIDVRNR